MERLQRAAPELYSTMGFPGVGIGANVGANTTAASPTSTTNTPTTTTTESTTTQSTPMSTFFNRQKQLNIRNFSKYRQIFEKTGPYLFEFVMN